MRGREDSEIREGTCLAGEIGEEEREGGAGYRKGREKVPSGGGGKN